MAIFRGSLLKNAVPSPVTVRKGGSGQFLITSFAHSTFTSTEPHIHLTLKYSSSLKALSKVLKL